MKEFLISFLIVFVFVFNASCMYPSTSSQSNPSPPPNVEFGECFCVRVNSKHLTTDFYTYQHICPELLPDGEHKPPSETTWYLVGWYSRSQKLDFPDFDYVTVTQSDFKFISMNEKIVQFLMSSTNQEFEITFQSLQQGQKLYEIIYNDVSMNEAAKSKIGSIHQILINSRTEEKIGDDINALFEIVNNNVILTFKNKEGKPILIFSEKKAGITVPEDYEKQLLLRINVTYFICTFSDNAEAHEFSHALLEFVHITRLNFIPPIIKSRFDDNNITADLYYA